MAAVTIEPTWNLALAIVALVALGFGCSTLGRLGHQKAIVTAAVRATVQLLGVSAVIVLAIQQLWSSLLFVLVMFVVGVFTTTGRVGNRDTWTWSAVAMAAGAIPVLAIIFISGTAPLNGYSLIPIGGIVIGNTMTAHTLVGRCLFAQLRDNVGHYEAALALGFSRHNAVGLVIEPVAGEAPVPTLDATRTVGLVTLPGAFIGVLLGGGTPIQAGASQLLVLIGILAAQSATVMAANEFIRRAKLLPADLRARLRP